MQAQAHDSGPKVPLHTFVDLVKMEGAIRSFALHVGDPVSTVHGAWCMVHGAWCMVHGSGSFKRFEIIVLSILC